MSEEEKTILFAASRNMLSRASVEFLMSKKNEEKTIRVVVPRNNLSRESV